MRREQAWSRIATGPTMDLEKTAFVGLGMLAARLAPKVLPKVIPAIKKVTPWAVKGGLGLAALGRLGMKVAPRVATRAPGAVGNAVKMAPDTSADLANRARTALAGGPPPRAATPRVPPSRQPSLTPEQRRQLLRQQPTSAGPTTVQNTSSRQSLGG